MRTSTRAARRRRRHAVTKIAVFATLIACIVTAGVLIAAALTDKPAEPPQATESAEQQEPNPEPITLTSEPTEQAAAISEAPEQSTAQEPRYIYYNVPLADDLQEYTQDLCNEYGVQYELVLALMSAESGYRMDGQ